MLTPAVAPPFPLAWGFTTREDSESLLPPERLKQIHGVAVVEASDQVQPADGLWTRTPGLAIGIQVADCVPVLLAGRIRGEPWAAALIEGCTAFWAGRHLAGGTTA